MISQYDPCVTEREVIKDQAKCIERYRDIFYEIGNVLDASGTTDNLWSFADLPELVKEIIQENGQLHRELFTLKYPKTL